MIKKLLGVFIVSAAIFAISCSNSSSGGGSLSTDDIVAINLTIENAGNISGIAKYQVTVTRDGVAVSDDTITAVKKSYTFGNLGTYAFAVYGLDSNGTKLASGYSERAVTSYGIYPVTVTLISAVDPAVPIAVTKLTASSVKVSGATDFVDSNDDVKAILQDFNTKSELLADTGLKALYDSASGVSKADLEAKFPSISANVSEIANIIDAGTGSINVDVGETGLSGIVDGVSGSFAGATVSVKVENKYIEIDAALKNGSGLTVDFADGSAFKQGKINLNGNLKAVATYVDADGNYIPESFVANVAASVKFSSVLSLNDKGLGGKVVIDGEASYKGENLMASSKSDLVALADNLDVDTFNVTVKFYNDANAEVFIFADIDNWTDFYNLYGEDLTDVVKAHLSSIKSYLKTVKNALTD